jgi:hypothetical protein
MNLKYLFILLFFLSCFIISFSQQNFKGNYSYASERKLELEELEKLTTFDLRIMRNEIYARHGYIFKSFFMNEYFKIYEETWYNPLYINVEDKLTELEKENIRLIKNVEDGTFLSRKIIGDSINDFETAFFKKSNSGHVVRNISYDKMYLSVYPNTYNFLIKEINDVVSDYNVDGDHQMTTIELYNVDYSSGGLTIYNRIKTSDKSVKIEAGNKIIYQTETPLLGTDVNLCRLVDLEDDQPFILSNFSNQIYRLGIPPKQNRWISYYMLASNDWVYDRDWRKIKYKDFDSIQFEKYGTIVYSNEDTIFQMIDIYKTKEYNLTLNDSEIELSFPKDFKSYRRDFSYTNLFLKNYKDFQIIYWIDGERIELNVDGKNIEIGEYKNEKIRIIKRDVSNYKIN